MSSEQILDTSGVHGRKVSALPKDVHIPEVVSQFLGDYFGKTALAHRDISRAYQSAVAESMSVSSKKNYPKLHLYPLPDSLDELYKKYQIENGNIAKLFDLFGIDLEDWINPRLKVAEIDGTLAEITPVLNKIISDFREKGTPLTWETIVWKFNYSQKRRVFPIQGKIHLILGCQGEIHEILHHLGVIDTGEDVFPDPSFIVTAKTQEAVVESLGLEIPEWKRLLIQYFAGKRVKLTPDDIADIKFGIIRYSQSGKEKQNRSLYKFPIEIDDFLGDELGDQIFASHEKSSKS